MRALNGLPVRVLDDERDGFLCGDVHAEPGTFGPTPRLQFAKRLNRSARRR